MAESAGALAGLAPVRRGMPVGTNEAGPLRLVQLWFTPDRGGLIYARVASKTTGLS